MTPLISAASFLIRIVFDAYIILLLLRLILQKLGASWHNPISQFVIRLTEKPITPFRKFIPGFKGFDLAIVVLALIIQIIEVTLLVLLQINAMPNFSGVAVISIGELASKIIYIYIYAIIINAIASWIPSLQTHPIAHIIHVIVHPLLSRAQRVIPIVAGIDISPIPILLGLMLINILFVAPLLGFGANLAVR